MGRNVSLGEASFANQSIQLSEIAHLYGRSSGQNRDARCV